MKKQLTALTVSIILAIQSTSSLASYYADRDLPNISPEYLKYKAYDISVIDGYISDLKNILYIKGNDDKAEKLLKTIIGEMSKINQSYTLAKITEDIKYNEQNVNETTNAYSVYSKTSQKIDELFREMYASSYVSVMYKVIGQNLVDDMMEDLPSKKFYELSEEEERLLNEYSANYGDNNASAKTFIKLLSIRNSIAKELGYDDYVEYAFNLYYRDYDEAEIEKFSKAVEENFKPILKKLLPLIAQFTYKSTDNLTQSEVIERAGDVINAINPELYGSFKYMLDNNLYNADYNTQKSQSAGSYTTILADLKVPYMFITPMQPYEDQSYDTLQTLIHESGHYSALLHDPQIGDELYGMFGATVIDTAEIHSQGLEMLAQSYYGYLFGSDAQTAKYEQYLSILSAIIEGCIYNEWQTEMYKTEKPTVEMCNDKFKELIKNYLDTDISTKTAMEMWTRVQHNFSAPMYYISYATSATAALQILTDSKKDYDMAVNKYMTLSAEGCGIPIEEALYKSGFRNVFQQDVVKDIADEFIKICGMNYTDVTADDWYETCVFQTVDFIDGLSDTEFGANKAITRGDFAETIGKMHYYYNIDNKEYPDVTFKDVNTVTDDRIKYIKWAVASNVMDGYSDAEFGINDTITREQMITVLYRIATDNSKGEYYKDKQFLNDINGTFADFSDTSNWAKEAMQWSIWNLVISGDNNDRLNPNDSTTRAEVATILSNCLMYSDIIEP